MLPDNNQTHYAIAKLEESARIIKQSINELPLVRKRLDRYKDNKSKAREAYTDLSQQHSRLLAALGTSTLALSEMELPEIAGYIELDSYRAVEAIARLDRVGFGSYFRSRISHESFHLMLLNPPYLSVMTEGGNNTRSEKRFLVDALYHLIYGGLLIYIIPHYRLTADICRVLCDNPTWNYPV